MTLQVSTLVDLAEDQGCVPRAYIHGGSQPSIYNTNSKGYNVLF